MMPLVSTSVVFFSLCARHGQTKYTMFKMKEKPKVKGLKLSAGFLIVSYGHVTEEYGAGCQLISIWW